MQAAAKHAEERDAARDKIKEMTEASSSAESVGNERLKGWEEQKARADGLDKELEEAKKTIAEVEKAAKEASRSPKTAEKFLKAASGPIGKAIEALDEGHVGDPDEVKALIAAIEGNLAALKAHAALTV